MTSVETGEREKSEDEDERVGEKSLSGFGGEKVRKLSEQKAVKVLVIKLETDGYVQMFSTPTKS